MLSLLITLALAMTLCIPLTKWVIIAPARDMPNLGGLIQTMQKVATPMGFQISPEKEK